MFFHRRGIPVRTVLEHVFWCERLPALRGGGGSRRVAICVAVALDSGFISHKSVYVVVLQKSTFPSIRQRIRY